MGDMEECGLTFLLIALSMSKILIAKSSLYESDGD
jgi:hypothetical protein